MEAPSGYNKAEARSYFFENYRKVNVELLAEKVFHKLVKGLQKICSEREDIGFDFTRSKIITSNGMSNLKGIARLQTSAARHLLVKQVASFAKKCNSESEREGELIHQYLVNKLLKNTNCKTTDEFLREDNCVINSSHFLRFLNLVRNVSYISSEAKQKRNKKRAAQEAALIDKNGPCFPVKVKYMPSSVTCEFFDQVIINGKPFAFFRSDNNTRELAIRLPEHTVIVIHPLHFEKGCYIKAKSVLILDEITVGADWCKVTAPKESVNVILNSRLNKDPHPGIVGRVINDRCTAAYCAVFKKTVNLCLSGKDTHRIPLIAGVLFNLARYVLLHPHSSPTTTPEMHSAKLANSIDYRAEMLQIPRITYMNPTNQTKEPL